MLKEYLRCRFTNDKDVICMAERPRTTEQHPYFGETLGRVPWRPEFLGCWPVVVEQFTS